MSVFKRLWQRFLKPTYFVGKDLEGNKYFEYPTTVNGRLKRTVQYPRNEDMWAYVASGKRLPVQWNAWLTHTRRDPPTLEELEADLVRQKRVQINAAMIEVRDKEERERAARIAKPSDSRTPEVTGTELTKAPPEQQKNVYARDPWTEAKGGSDQPESWNPVARRR
ncbi:hypothetical protein F5I97DRAFT_1927235 [Phlebopus sp. FC_14]|nr:hypothetical protein F5I97DRAFT_1927235 [Phlebopus sp. FC_14]